MISLKTILNDFYGSKFDNLCSLPKHKLLDIKTSILNTQNEIKDLINNLRKLQRIEDFDENSDLASLQFIINEIYQSNSRNFNNSCNNIIKHINFLFKCGHDSKVDDDRMGNLLSFIKRQPDYKEFLSEKLLKNIESGAISSSLYKQLSKKYNIPEVELRQLKQNVSLSDCKYSISSIEKSFSNINYFLNSHILETVDKALNFNGNSNLKENQVITINKLAAELSNQNPEIDNYEASKSIVKMFTKNEVGLELAEKQKLSTIDMLNNINKESFNFNKKSFIDPYIEFIPEKFRVEDGKTKNRFISWFYLKTFIPNEDSTLFIKSNIIIELISEVPDFVSNKDDLISQLLANMELNIINIEFLGVENDYGPLSMDAFEMADLYSKQQEYKKYIFEYVNKNFKLISLNLDNITDNKNELVINDNDLVVIKKVSILERIRQFFMRK